MATGPKFQLVGVPLAPLALALTAGIMAGSTPDGVSRFFICMAGAGSLALCRGFPGRVLFQSGMAAALFIYGWAMIFRIDGASYSDHHIASHARGTSQVITGRVVSFGRHYAGKTRFKIACETLKPALGKGKAGSFVAVEGAVFLTLKGQVARESWFGRRVEFKGRLKQPRNFGNPGAFDYVRYLRRQGVGATVWTSGVELLPEDEPGILTSLFYGVGRYIENWRNRFYFFLVPAPQTPETAHIIAALVTGKKHSIPPSLRDDFSRGGASHLLAISGLHMGILALVFYQLVFRAFRWARRPLITGAARKWAGALTLIPLAAFVIFSGSSPSSIRAFIMTCAVMAALLSETETHPMNLLALAALVILTPDVTALFSISFQLSFAALVFLLLGADLLPAMSRESRSRSGRFFLGIAMATLLAGTGTAPLVSHYFNLLSLVQLPVNLVLVPLVGMLCLPLAFAIFLVFMVSPDWAVCGLGICEWLAGVGLSWLRFWIELPLAWCRPGMPTVGAMVLIYGMLLALLWGVKFRDRWKPAGAVFFVCGVMWLGVKWWPGQAPAPLEVVVLDVGQGNSALIRTSCGRRILVDGGGFGGASGFDVGRYVVAPYLWRQGISSLDAVILSHPESDHMKGLVFILENFKVDAFVRGAERQGHPAMDRLLELCGEKQIRLISPDCEVPELTMGPLALEFLQCGTVQPGFDYNNNSLVFRLVFKEFSMLWPGDILRKREYLLVQEMPERLNALVMLAPHHGSNSSSNDFLLDQILPQSVIISCGWSNRYGFPHPNVLSRYRARNIRVFRTDLHGAVTLRTQGTEFNILTHKGE